jgi:hypothetical protein
MKNGFFAVLLLGFCFSPLFSFESSYLERRIILASPEEMVGIVQDRSLEAQLLEICERYEETQDLNGLVEALQNAFPGTSMEECQIMLFKLGLVSFLGSGDRDLVYQGMDLLIFCLQADSMVALGEAPEEFGELFNSRYWKDCVEFGKVFDSDAFLQERFPGDFPEEFFEEDF